MDRFSDANSVQAYNAGKDTAVGEEIEQVKEKIEVIRESLNDY